MNTANTIQIRSYSVAHTRPSTTSDRLGHRTGCYPLQPPITIGGGAEIGGNTQLKMSVELYGELGVEHGDGQPAPS